MPEVTALFWVIKISTTAAGEAHLGHVRQPQGNSASSSRSPCSSSPSYLQFALASIRSLVTYWFLALAIATAGTGVADTMHLVLGLPYAVTSLFWMVVLAAVFFLWNRSEHTLDIHSITTNRREKYYWAVVFATFASAPRSATSPPRPSASATSPRPLFFCGVILIPLAGWKFLNWNSIFAFWFAYVITRPIGASFADYLSKGHDISGADFGDWQTALLFTCHRRRSSSPTRPWPATTSSRPATEVAGGT